MFRICQFVFLCILCNPMQSNAMTEEEQAETEYALTTNNAFGSMVSIREDYGVQPSLIYDIELTKQTCKKKSIHLTVEPITEKYYPATNNKEFWRAVIYVWSARMQTFFANQWTSVDTTDEPALLYFLYICSAQTERVLMKETRMYDGGTFIRDEYTVTTYFHPILPQITTESATAFRFIDAFYLLNSARKFFNTPKVELSFAKMEKADEILKSLQHTISEYHISGSTGEETNIKPYAEGNDGQEMQLLEHLGEYSIFIYKIPADEDLTNYITKFPYALMQHLLFTAYEESIQQYQEDPLFYTQIRRDCYQLLNPQIEDIGMSAKIISRLGKRYSLFVIYQSNPNSTKPDMSKLDTSVQHPDFNVQDIPSSNPRYFEIIRHLGSLPTLDLKKNILRYKEMHMQDVKNLYKP